MGPIKRSLRMKSIIEGLWKNMNKWSQLKGSVRGRFISKVKSIEGVNLKGLLMQLGGRCSNRGVCFGSLLWGSIGGVLLKGVYQRNM